MKLTLLAECLTVGVRQNMTASSMCALLEQHVSSFLIGAASSAVVAYIFYRISRGDTQSLHRQAQLDSVAIRLKQLDPQSWPDNYRGHWGVDNMIHWMTCMSELMRESGFAAGGTALEEIIVEMKHVCPGPNQPSPLTAAQAEQKKKEWEARVRTLGAIQPRSFLNRPRGSKGKEKLA